MTEPAEFRYSTGHSAIGHAKNFPWEYAVPNTEFWKSLDFVIGRNFLKCFSRTEIDEMNLEQAASISQTAKFELLLSLLQKKLVLQDGLAKESPNSGVDSLADAAQHPTIEDVGPADHLYTADFDSWGDLFLGIYTLQNALGQKARQEKTIRLLIEKRTDKTNLSYFHTLAGLLEETGRYKEAEETEEQVKIWLDRKLGKDSPQALGARRLSRRRFGNKGEKKRRRSYSRRYLI